MWAELGNALTSGVTGQIMQTLGGAAIGYGIDRLSGGNGGIGAALGGLGGLGNSFSSGFGGVAGGFSDTFIGGGVLGLGGEVAADAAVDGAISPITGNADKLVLQSNGSYALPGTAQRLAQDGFAGAAVPQVQIGAVGLNPGTDAALAEVAAGTSYPSVFNQPHAVQPVNPDTVVKGLTPMENVGLGIKGLTDMGGMYLRYDQGKNESKAAKDAMYTNLAMHNSQLAETKRYNDFQENRLVAGDDRRDTTNSGAIGAFDNSALAIGKKKKRPVPTSSTAM